MSSELVDELTSIGCKKNTSINFNEIKSDIAKEVKIFHSGRIKKQDITLQCLIKNWQKSPEDIKMSIIHGVIRDLKVNE